MPTPIAYTNGDKGDPIIVVKGKYANFEGWIHNGCVQPKKMLHVILKAQGTYEEACRCISRESIETDNRNEVPQSFTEALLKEHKDIDTDLRNLASKLAEVDGLSPNTELFSVLWKLWEEKKAIQDNKTSKTVRLVRTWQPSAPSQTSTGTATSYAAATAARDLPSQGTGVTLHVIPDGWENDRVMLNG